MPLRDGQSLGGLRLEPRHLGLALVLAAGTSVAVLAQTAPPPPASGTPNAPAAAPQVPSGDETKARAAALAAKANVDVVGAWTRATNGNAASADVYLQITSAKDADRLMSVDAAAAKDVQVQRTGNVAVPLPIEIPPGGTVDFSPTTQHLTLIGLKAPLRQGDSFLITFHFDKAGTENTAVRILAPNANGLPSETLARRGDTTAGVTQR